MNSGHEFSDDSRCVCEFITYSLAKDARKTVV